MPDESVPNPPSNKAIPAKSPKPKAKKPDPAVAAQKRPVKKSAKGAATTLSTAPAPAPDSATGKGAPAPAAKKAGIKPAAKPVATPKKPKAAKRIDITHEEISIRAYLIGESRQRNGIPGGPESDWLEAERQVRAEKIAQAS